uniref:Protein kinase domain-containing protein n=1 Tax=Bursaphelenchus xylophilus TaxID=6326 RepID=A0A1I7RU03_BURXY
MKHPDGIMSVHAQFIVVNSRTVDLVSEQYLQVVHNCELNPTVPRDKLKNVYVRFMHVPPKRTAARRRGLLTERGKVLVGLSAGFLGVVLIAFVGSAPLWYKWSPWGGAWRREKKPVPNTDLEKDGWSSNRDRDDDAPRDSYGNVDWNLLTRDYRDQYRAVDFKETFKDDDFGLPLPKVTDDSFSLRFHYEHVKTLSHGKMRAVHQYGIGDGSFVAIKFMVAKDEVEMERAKQEIALLRFFWDSNKSMPKEKKQPHLAKVGDSGRYQNVIFYSMNFFARSIQDVLEDLPCSNYGQKLNVCYQMLQGILELQRLGYAHGDLKPANFMQKRLNDNLVGLAGRFEVTGTTDPQRRTEMLHLSHVLHTDQNMNHSLRKYPNNYCEDGDSGKPNRPPESDWRKQWRTARGARF